MPSDDAESDDAAPPPNGRLRYESDARGISFVDRPDTLGRARRSRPMILLAVRDRKLLISRPETVDAVPVIVPAGRVRFIEVLTARAGLPLGTAYLSIRVHGSRIEMFHGCSPEELHWVKRRITEELFPGSGSGVHC